MFGIREKGKGGDNWEKWRMGWGFGSGAEILRKY